MITQRQHDIVRSVQGRKAARAGTPEELHDMRADGLLFNTTTGFNATRWHVTVVGLAAADEFEQAQVAA